MNNNFLIGKVERLSIDENVVQQMIELMDTAIEASLEIISLYREKKYDIVNRLLKDLQKMMKSLENNVITISKERSFSLVGELLENIQCTLDLIFGYMYANDSNKTIEKMEFQLFPFLRCLRESFYFWGMIYPNRDRMNKYYEEEFAKSFSNPYVTGNDNYEYDLSIVVPAYNHLDVTKRCIEQLMKVTDLKKINAELILIDHGSSDETLDYFEGLGIGKVIHFKRNVRIYMFTVLPQICRGRYFVYLSNDVLVTKDWAEIGLRCIKSDEKIIAVVPTTPNISNLQMIHVPTDDPDDFIKWAEMKNEADSSKWNDRARIMPPIGIYSTKLVSEVGFVDPLFHSMEFFDDDFSLRARRAGYRQIVCDDVACYHFGSVTGKEFQKKESTLVYGRELFRNKHGVDAWGPGFCYDYQKISFVKQIINNKQGEMSFLGIDCGFGDTSLQIKNEMRHINRECIVCNINSQIEYDKDLKYLVDGYEYHEHLNEGIENCFKEKQFDVIWIEQGLENYENLHLLMKNISGRLSLNGSYICYCSNPFSVLNLSNIMNFSLEKERMVLLNVDSVINDLKKYFSKIRVIPINKKVDDIEAFAKKYYGDVSKLQQLINKLLVDKYYFLCEK